MAPQLHWSTDVADLFAATSEIPETHERVFLVAEAVPDGGWDWAAWSHRGRHSSLSGHATTRETAMRKAELAARAIRIAQMVEAA